MAAFSATNSPNIFSQLRRHRPNFHPRYCTPSPSNLVKSHLTPQYFAPRNNRHPMSRITAPISTAQFSAASTVDLEDSTSTSILSFDVKRWEEFAEKVSGEWDGFGADFTVEGNPIELPEMVVPEAYREWEVKVFDWQTQCPTLAQLVNSSSPSLIYKTIQLLPTVGCEADAATRHSIHERNVDESSAFAYQSSTGSYVALWPINATESNSMELEHCLIDPRDKESRVRIIQVLRLQDSKLTLKGIKVFVEQWYGPFRNGDQLGGCAIRDSAFAATQPLKASQVVGVWQGLSAVATLRTTQNVIQQLGDERVSESSRDANDLILLPKQLWCSVRKAVNEEETHCEVGWLLDQGRAVTSKCIITSTGELKEIAIANETASVA